LCSSAHKHEDRALGLELAMATARWRPGGGGARVASAGDAREGGEQRWERQRAMRRHLQKLELELGARRWQ
jgi:hypothetical protein